MLAEIESQYLKGVVASLGAELKSLKNKQNGFEYIWQGDATYWERSAPILFPSVGEVNRDTIYVNETPYKLKRHGFARNSEFVITKQEKNSVAFTLNSNTETGEVFPFDFSFTVTYTLTDKELITTFTVKNPGERDLYFSVGGHPAFNLPGEKLDDYFIEFLQPEVMERHLLRDNLFSGETEMLYNYTRYLPLNTSLFDKDAIVFKNLQSTLLALKSIKGDYMLQMEFEGFPYLGIWTKPNCEKFVCIEPWCGLADRAGYEGEFKNREGINSLAPGEGFERSFTIGCM